MSNYDFITLEILLNVNCHLYTHILVCETLKLWYSSSLIFSKLLLIQYMLIMESQGGRVFQTFQEMLRKALIINADHEIYHTYILPQFLFYLISLNNFRRRYPGCQTFPNSVSSVYRHPQITTPAK